MRLLCILAAAFLLAGMLHGQERQASPGTSTVADSLLQHATSDTARIAGARFDTLSPPTSGSKKPLLAVGLSAIAPGAGQIYDHSYWKLPIIWGLGGYWVSQWIELNRNYKDYRDQYAKSLVGHPSGDHYLKEQRDFYRDERDKFAWYLGVLYALNLLDAYVGAQLYDFDVSPNLGANGHPGGVTATVRWKL